MLTRAMDAPQLAGKSPAIKHIRDNFERLSASRAPLLLVGEPGTGKEETARALHRHAGGLLSGFVVASLSEAAPGELEEELFAPDGAFMRANEGTVYFDEIEYLTPALQARLLRLLHEGEFCPAGHNRPVKTGARVIAATSAGLGERAAAGLFNQRLADELGEHRIALPPLRERREDLPALVRSYLAQEAAELSIMAKNISPAALRRLARLDWPGNLPQLESVCRRATAFTAGRLIDIDDLPEDLWRTPHKPTENWSAALDEWARAALDEGATGLLDTVLPQVERTLICAALEKTGGQRQEAARLLGWGRNTLTRKIKDLEIDPDEGGKS